MFRRKDLKPFFIFKQKLAGSIWWNSKLAKKVIPRSVFAKNVAILSGGTLVAQIIGVATIPIFTRLYSPRDFGIYALFVSLSGMIKVIASGRYELAILLPKREKNAVNLVFLGSVISFIFALATLSIVLLFSKSISILLGEQGIRSLLILLPFDVFIYGIYNSLLYWSNRKKLYKIMSLETLLSSITQAILRFGLFFVFRNERGLVYAYLAAHFVSFVFLVLNNKQSINLRLINVHELKRVAKKYIQFPKFSVPSALTNSLSHQLTSISMPNLFNTQTLGYYSQANSILGLPLTLISGSMGKVFFQQASEEKNRTGKAGRSFNKTLARLTWVSLPLFLLIFIFIRPATAVFLGKQWVETGKYAQILVPLYAVRFISSALSVSVAVSGKMLIAFIRDLLLFLGVVVSILMVVIFDFTLSQYLIFFSIMLGIQYSAAILVYRKISMMEVN